MKPATRKTRFAWSPKSINRSCSTTCCELCTEHGAADPQTLAKQLLILIDGAITVALVMGDYSAADNAQCMARKLLDL